MGGGEKLGRLVRSSLLGLVSLYKYLSTLTYLNIFKIRFSPGFSLTFLLPARERAPGEQNNCQYCCLSLSFLVKIEIRYNVPSSKNETCVFDLSVQTREAKDHGKPGSASGASVVGRSRASRDVRSRKRKCRKRNKNKKRNCRRKDNKEKPQKEEKRQSAPPESIIINICTRSVSSSFAFIVFYFYWSVFLCVLQIHNLLTLHLRCRGFSEGIMEIY